MMHLARACACQACSTQATSHIVGARVVVSHIASASVGVSNIAGTCKASMTVLSMHVNIDKQHEGLVFTPQGTGNITAQQE